MKNDGFEYDIAVSFAEAEAAIAKELASELTHKGFAVFLDEYKSPGQWGTDVVDHLVNLFDRKARYAVLLVSRSYPLQSWTLEERTEAREQALRDSEEYIVPVVVDDVEVAGISEVGGYQDLRRQTVEDVADWLAGKLKAEHDRTGPPAKSHDLRSGNVPE